MGEESLGRADTREDCPGDHGDAPEVRERNQAERRQGPEAAVTDRPEVVRVERTGHPGDERGDAEPHELGVADVDPGCRGGTLVGAHGEHPLSQARAPHVGDQHAEGQRGSEDEKAEHRARELVVQAPEGRVGRQIEPPELRLLDGRPLVPAAPALVQETELLERDGGGERDDHETDPPDA